MAGQLKVDSINADSNLSFRIANTAVAFIDSNGLRPTSGNVSLDSTGTTGIRLPAANTLAFHTAGTEDVRIDSSGNVGIGTTSPAAPLDVVSDSGSSAISVRGRSADNLSAIRIYSNNGATQYGVIRGAADELRVNATEAIPLTFYTNNTERMRIDSSGRVTMPYQPAFLAVRTAGTVSSGSIVFNDVQFNIGSHYNASNGIFTAPIAGRYLFCLQAITNNIDGNIYINLNKNGTLTGISAYGAGPSTYYKNISFSVILELSANDYINLSVGSGAVYAAGDGGNPRFSGALLG